MSTKKIDSKRGLEAVLSLLRREGTASEIARRFKMSEGSLYRLRDKFLEGGKSALSAYGSSNGVDKELKELRRDIAERDRVIGEITIANRILKKTADGLL